MTRREAAVARWILGGAAAFLLASFGMQILLAPITLPLLWFAGRSASSPARVALDAIAALTGFFVIAGAVSLAIDTDAIVLWTALLAIPLTFVAFWRSQSRVRRDTMAARVALGGAVLLAGALAAGLTLSGDNKVAVREDVSYQR